MLGGQSTVDSFRAASYFNILKISVQDHLKWYKCRWERVEELQFIVSVFLHLPCIKSRRNSVTHGEHT
jgi:hypothetical protein